MSEFELRINVYDSSKVGHANVSFYENDQHVYTIGANIRMQVPFLAVPKIIPFEPDDGIYQDETAFHAQALETGTVTSAVVPITNVQYSELLSSARELEGQTFNYSVLTEACIELVDEFYEATGHHGRFGDLFAEEQRSGSLIWTRVPVSDEPYADRLVLSQPIYEPPEEFLPDPQMPQSPNSIAPPADIPSSESEDAPPDTTEPGSPAFTANPLLLDEIIHLPSPITLPSAQISPWPEPILTQGEMPQVPLEFSDRLTESTRDAFELLREPNAPNLLSIDEIDDLPMEFGTATGVQDTDPVEQDSSSFIYEEVSFDSSADRFESLPAEPDDDFHFLASEPAVDLSYGNEVDGSNLMVPALRPTEALGYSLDESALYEQGHHDYETFM